MEQVSEKVVLTKERVNEIAYALLIAVLSNQDIKLNPEQFKRKLCNMPQQLKFLPEQFRGIKPEELQVATREILHDLVDFSLNFDLLSSRKKGKRR